MINSMQPKSIYLKDRHKNLRLLVVKKTTVNNEVRLPYAMRLIRGLKIDDSPQIVSPLSGRNSTETSVFWFQFIDISTVLKS